MHIDECASDEHATLQEFEALASGVSAVEGSGATCTHCYSLSHDPGIVVHATMFELRSITKGIGGKTKGPRLQSLLTI